MPAPAITSTTIAVRDDSGNFCYLVPEATGGAIDAAEGVIRSPALFATAAPPTQCRRRLPCHRTRRRHARQRFEILLHAVCLNVEHTQSSQRPACIHGPGMTSQLGASRLTRFNAARHLSGRNQTCRTDRATPASTHASPQVDGGPMIVAGGSSPMPMWLLSAGYFGTRGGLAGPTVLLSRPCSS